MVSGESSSHSARQKNDISPLKSRHLALTQIQSCKMCWANMLLRGSDNSTKPLRKQLEATFSILQARYSCNTAQAITTTHLCLIIALFRIKTGNFLVRDRHEVERVCGHAHSTDCFSNLPAQLRLFSLTLAEQIWYWYWSLLLWSFLG